jgi:hypothetical protein
MRFAKGFLATRSLILRMLFFCFVILLVFTRHDGSARYDDGPDYEMNVEGCGVDVNGASGPTRKVD